MPLLSGKSTPSPNRAIVHLNLHLPSTFYEECWAFILSQLCYTHTTMIIYLHGPETFLSRQKLKQFREKFTREVDTSGMNLIELDGASIEAHDFEQAVATPAFLAPKRMVVVTELLSKNRKTTIHAAVLEFLNSVNHDDTIIVFWEGETKPTKKALKLHTFLSKQKFSQEFKKLSPQQVTEWIVNFCAERSITIQRQALDKLSSAVGDNVWQAHAEAQKLIAYANGAEINSEMVDDLVVGKIDDNIFALTDAIGARNTKVAVQLLHDQFALGTAPLELLSKISWHVRNLLLVKQSSDVNPRALGLHPFVARKAEQQAKNFSLQQLTGLYGQLVMLDRQFKSSAVDPELLFDLLLTEQKR